MSRNWDTGSTQYVCGEMLTAPAFRWMSSQEEDLLDEGNDGGAEGFFVEAVLAVEADGVGIVFLEEVVGVDQRIVDAEKAPGVFLVKVGDALELMHLHHKEMLDNLFGDTEVLGVVLAAVQELMNAGAQHLGEFGHIEGRIDANLAVTVHLLGIHPAHRSTDNQVRLLRSDQRLQKRQRLHRVHRNVRRQHLHFGQHRAEHLRRPRRA